MDKTEKRITTTYAINVAEKRVIAQFSMPLENLMMSPTEASAMASILLNCAKALDPAVVEGFVWPGMEKPVELQLAPTAVNTAGVPS